MSGRFYVTIAAICVAIAFIGFAPTYWVPLARGRLSVSPLVHLHALVFFGWTFLFLAQTRLAATGRLTRHRELGVAGVSLATAMVFVGFAAAIAGIKRGDAQGIGPAVRAFSIVPVSDIVLFAVLIAIAIRNVANPEVHKRLMLVATAMLLTAAIGRWFALFLAPPGAVGPPPVFVTVPPSILADSLIVAAMIRDRRTLGHVHRAYWIAGVTLLAVQLLRVPLSATAAWARVADFLTTLTP